MCGIVGFLRFDQQKISADVCTRLSVLLAHRGPDDEGFLLADTATGKYQIAGGPDTPEDVYHADLPFTPKESIEKLKPNDYNFALINRRLAIVDLSPAGHLPMSTEDCSIWLAYNGQVYNFVELREELQKLGYRFYGNSDSEVILKAYKAWGTECFRKFNGMWAIAIWDVLAKKLVLSRDHFGIKPLYYWHTENIFAFASEIKCLLELGAPRDVNEGLVYDYLNWGLLDHTNETFFARIQKLPAAHFLEIDWTNQIKIERFWDFEVSSELHSEKTDEYYAEQFKEIFIDSVRLRLRSDVPVGSCLSGGLDSSAIVTVANKLLFPPEQRDVQERHKTFSSCFPDPRFDEREYIEEVVRTTQVEANYIFPQAKEFLAELENLVWHQEEPFRSSSIYAQWCVMRRARERGIIVMLDGQGGDELLCGYRKFYIFYLMELLKQRRIGRLLLEGFAFLSSPEILGTLNIRHGLRYFALGQRIQGTESIFLPEFRRRFAQRIWGVGYNGNLSQRIKTDITQFSLPVLLRYEDKNSMAHSVEARLPFLDHRLVEAIATFPMDQKMRRGWTKYVLRQALKGILPEKIRLRKSKLGFVTPEDEWFKQTLSNHVEKIFAQACFLPEYINVNSLRERYARYRSGQTTDTSEFFFRFFILELWGRRFIIKFRKD
jgi:asparagine synthase (glutamine-hydrolysing)